MVMAGHYGSGIAGALALSAHGGWRLLGSGVAPRINDGNGPQGHITVADTVQNNIEYETDSYLISTMGTAFSRLPPMIQAGWRLQGFEDFRR
ncbi:hypothetical protein GCM10027195_26510 [Comamonas sediminis]